MQSFIVSHSSCAEQYGDMSSDTQTHSHTIKPPTAGVRQVGHTSIILVLLLSVSAVSEKASCITPVPGGVGPMTVAMLMRNTLLAARSDIPYDRGDSVGRKQTGRGKGGGDGKGGGKGRKEGEGRKKGRGSGGKKGEKEEPKEGRGEGRKEGGTDRKGGFGRKKS